MECHRCRSMGRAALLQLQWYPSSNRLAHQILQLLQRWRRQASIFHRCLLGQMEHSWNNSHNSGVRVHWKLAAAQQPNYWGLLWEMLHAAASRARVQESHTTWARAQRSLCRRWLLAAATVAVHVPLSPPCTSRAHSHGVGRLAKPNSCCRHLTPSRLHSCAACRTRAPRRRILRFVRLSCRTTACTL